MAALLAEEAAREQPEFSSPKPAAPGFTMEVELGNLSPRAPVVESPLEAAMRSQRSRAATRNNLLPVACAAGAFSPTHLASKVRVPEVVKCKGGGENPFREPERTRCGGRSGAAARRAPPPPPARGAEKTRCGGRGAAAPARGAEATRCGRGPKAPPTDDELAAQLFTREPEYLRQPETTRCGRGAPARDPERTRCGPRPREQNPFREPEKTRCGRRG